MKTTKSPKTVQIADKRLRLDKKTPNGIQAGIKGSFYEKNKHILGSLSSKVTDLSSNKEHLKGFGRSRNAGNL